MDYIKLAKKTIAMLSSIIESGECHTTRSREMKDNALNGLEQLRIHGVVPSARTKPAIDYSTCCVPSILDACCGSRMFWFDKDNPEVLFIDKRKETLTTKDRNKIRTIEIDPDLVADFTNMPFDDKTFHMVVFDPPHLKTLGKTSWLAKKYGKLPDNWEEVISKGFDECMRVLKPNGALIFKWNEHEIKVRQVLDLIPYKPLFGHTTGRSGKTIWMAFMKFS